MLQVKLFYPDAQAPKRGSEAAAGYDLYSYENVTIAPHETALIETGIGVAVPSGTYGRIAPRSGLSTKGIMINAGVVDEDYRGMIRVVVHNMKYDAFVINKGDRIAQLICERISTPEVAIVEELSSTARGDGGFGSTGV